MAFAWMAGWEVYHYETENQLFFFSGSETADFVAETAELLDFVQIWKESLFMNCIVHTEISASYLD